MEILKRNKNICPHKDLYSNVQGGFIYNSQKLYIPSVHQDINGICAFGRQNMGLIVYNNLMWPK